MVRVDALTRLQFVLKKVKGTKSIHGMLTLMSAFVMFSLNTASSNGNVASRCGRLAAAARLHCHMLTSLVAYLSITLLTISH